MQTKINEHSRCEVTLSFHFAVRVDILSGDHDDWVNGCEWQICTEVGGTGTYPSARDDNFTAICRGVSRFAAVMRVPWDPMLPFHDHGDTILQMDKYLIVTSLVSRSCCSMFSLSISMARSWSSILMSLSTTLDFALLPKKHSALSHSTIRCRLYSYYYSKNPEKYLVSKTRLNQYRC